MHLKLCGEAVSDASPTVFREFGNLPEISSNKYNGEPNNSGGYRMRSVYKIVIFIVVIGLNAQHMWAQEKEKTPHYGWTNKVVGSLNLTQTGFDNWAAGGENSMAWQLNFQGQFVNDQEKFNWNNNFKISYGMIKSGSDIFKKSVDEIRAESVARYKAEIFLKPYIALNGETQASAGYDYSVSPKKEISNFLDPGYFRESLGLGYVFSPWLQTRFGASMKQTVTQNFPRYSDDPATSQVEKLRWEYGAESVTDLNAKLSESLFLQSKLELFSNLRAFDEIDVNWDTVFIAKVAKYVEVNFNIKLLYDKDISVKRQLKQALSMGLTYTFL